MHSLGSLSSRGLKALATACVARTTQATTLSSSTQRGFATAAKPHPFDAFFVNRNPGTVGRAWRASELRLKSFEDIQKLWFVLLKERNMLVTYRELCRQKRTQMQGPERIGKVALSMTRIRTVIHQRGIEHRSAIIPKFKSNERRRVKIRSLIRAHMKRKLKPPIIKNHPLRVLGRLRKRRLFAGLKPRITGAPLKAEKAEAVEAEASV